MKRHTVVFDLDGTLVDTAPDLVRATNHVLAGLGLAPVEAARLRPTVSYGARALIEHALEISGHPSATSEVDALLERFLAYYADNIAVESRPFPEAVEAVVRLGGRGYRLAVCTNKREGLSRRLLKELGMDRLFHAIVGRDTLPVHKPDPGHLIGTVILSDGNLDRTVMVGDSEIDVRTAKAAGIPVIGATFGYSAEPIASFAPEATFDHYREIDARVEALMRGLEQET
jgi:phosphoglycolate phosphatase